jgi:hypothetical protein
MQRGAFFTTYHNDAYGVCVCVCVCVCVRVCVCVCVAVHTHMGAFVCTLARACVVVDTQFFLCIGVGTCGI